MTVQHSRQAFAAHTLAQPEEPSRAASLALWMSEEEACLILTLADEPDAILEPGEPAPLLDSDLVQAARIVSDWASLEVRPPVFH